MNVFQSNAGSARGTSTATSSQKSRAHTDGLPVVPQLPKGESLLKYLVEFYVFDDNSIKFDLRNRSVVATITKTAQFVYWLALSSDDKTIYCQKIEPHMNPWFDDKQMKFSWNYSDVSKTNRVSALFEVMNREVFSKISADDQSYVMRGVYSEDVEMEDAIYGEENEEFTEEYASEEDGEEHEECYSGSEDDEDTSPSGVNTSKNSLLDISHLHDRSFIVRGDKIGVFKQTPSTIKFQTTINAPFSPSKTLLHKSDRSLVLMNADDQHTLSHLDIETGKVVSNWQVHDEVPVTDIIHDAKFSNESTEETFIGLCDNQIFRIDPRQENNKLKETEWKTYASKVNFSCGSTTEKGELVIGSTKGELRFFNKIGMNAKTLLPGLGDPIIGIDSTASGHYVVATCKTYLLLVSTLHPDESTSAFKKAFPKAEKPAPIRLQLKSHHVALLQCPLSFTPAIFNSSRDSKETSIVTSTGPYVITWSLTSIEKGRLHDYSIKKYPERVVMDRFGSTLGGSLSSGAGKASVSSNKVDAQSIIVALENDVTMVRTGDLKAVEKVVGKPTKGNVKGNGVVNSPF